MKTKITSIVLITIVSALMSLASIDNEIIGQTSIEFQFLHCIDGKTVLYDTLCYQNEAGNKYMVSF